jgi:hypothetical protein
VQIGGRIGAVHKEISEVVFQRSANQGAPSGPQPSPFRPKLSDLVDKI